MRPHVEGLVEDVLLVLGRLGQQLPPLLHVHVAGGAGAHAPAGVPLGRAADLGGALLRVGSDTTYPPMETVDAATGQIVGFDVDVVNAVCEKINCKAEFVTTAWDGIFGALQQGEFDLVASGVSITDERKQTMDFSDPYVNAGQVLVVEKSLNGVSTLKDLVGKKVGAQIGTTGAFEIQKAAGVELATYDEVGLAFEDLANGRSAGVVADKPIAADFALQNPKFKDKLKIGGEPFTDEWLGIAVRKGDTKTLALINDGLAKIKANGK